MSPEILDHEQGLELGFKLIQFLNYLPLADTFVGHLRTTLSTPS